MEQYQLVNVDEMVEGAGTGGKKKQRHIRGSKLAGNMTQNNVIDTVPLLATSPGDTIEEKRNKQRISAGLYNFSADALKERADGQHNASSSSSSSSSTSATVRHDVHSLGAAKGTGGAIAKLIAGAGEDIVPDAKPSTANSTAASPSRGKVVIKKSASKNVSVSASPRATPISATTISN